MVRYTRILRIYSSITHTELYVGVFGTKCCALYSNEYGNILFNYLFEAFAGRTVGRGGSHATRGS